MSDAPAPGGGGWTFEPRELARGTLEHHLRRDGRPVSSGEVIAAWADGDASLARALSDVLADLPWDAFLWETPPVTRATAGRPFAFCAIESRALARMPPEPEVFARPLARVEQGVATFANLGGDAVLVAPAPDEHGPYPHLAAFCRRAPDELRSALWRAVGEAARTELGQRPLWISTSGLGVAWLHVRLDAFPKYYQHRPYRDGA